MKIIENKNDTFSLQKEDGSILNYEGQTEFGRAWENEDGSIQIGLDDGKCIIIHREIDNLFNNPSKEFVDKCLQVVFNHYLIAGNIFDKKHCEEIMEREITQDEFDVAQDRASNYYSSGDAYVGLEEFFDEIKEDD